MADSDDGCRKSLLTLLRLVRRPMSAKEMSQACHITERKVRTLMSELVTDLEVRVIPMFEDTPEQFCATNFTSRSQFQVAA